MLPVLLDLVQAAAPELAARAGDHRRPPRTRRPTGPPDPPRLRGCRSVAYDRERYKDRNVIEPAYEQLRQWRGLATRYDKLGGRERQAGDRRQHHEREHDPASAEAVRQWTSHQQGRDQTGGVTAEQGGERLRAQVQRVLVDQQQWGGHVRARRHGEQPSALRGARAVVPRGSRTERSRRGPSRCGRSRHGADSTPGRDCLTAPARRRPSCPPWRSHVLAGRNGAPSTGLRRTRCRSWLSCCRSRPARS